LVEDRPDDIRACGIFGSIAARFVSVSCTGQRHAERKRRDEVSDGQGDSLYVVCVWCQCDRSVATSPSWPESMVQEKTQEWHEMLYRLVWMRLCPYAWSALPDFRCPTRFAFGFLRRSGMAAYRQGHDCLLGVI
jgi:hypothetical protein